LLRALEFLPDAGDGDVPCLEALRVLKEMNDGLKRRLPDDAPTDFIPKRDLRSSMLCSTKRIRSVTAVARSKFPKCNPEADP
jgi:hypothetical protein